MGSKDLGRVKTSQLYGIAVPRDQLQQHLGPDPAVWRTARAIVTVKTGSARLFRSSTKDLEPTLNSGAVWRTLHRVNGARLRLDTGAGKTIHISRLHPMVLAQ
jgi:hypothetical protein